MDMLKKILLISVISSSSLFSCNAPQEQAKQSIGLQLYSVREDMKRDVRGTIAKVGEMGYDFVETAGYADGKFYGMEPQAFKALVEEHGMVFLSSHAGRNVPDENNWDETMAWWDQAIAAHKAAGVKYLVQASMGQVGYSSLEGLKRFCDYFNVVGEKCKKQGIQFGYHNHAKEFGQLEGVTIYDFMLQNTDPDKVMFQLDLYWIEVGGADPVAYFEKYPGRFVLWHIKDEAELGENGIMNFRPAFENAKKSGVEQIVVEVEKYNYEPLESVRKSLDYLRSLDYAKI
jgi:sugar phosphate isomerase/epimerase